MTDHFGNISINPDGEKQAPASSSTKKSRKSQKIIRRNDQSTSPKIKFFLSALLVICILSATYFTAGYWGVPHYVQSSLTAEFFQKTGMVLQFGQVRFDPLRFQLEIKDIAIHEQQSATTPILSANSLVTDIAPLPLFKGKLVTTQFIGDGFQLNIIRDLKGQFNYQQLLSGNTPKPPSEILDFSELPFLFSINNLSLTNGTISVKDQPNASSHLIENIQLTLPSFSNVAFTAKEYIQPSFSAIVNGSPVQLTGKTNFSDNDGTSATANTRLECEFDDINIPLYFAYLPDYFPVDITDGQGSGRFTLTFLQSAREDKLTVQFSISAKNVKAQDRKSLHFLSAPNAQVRGTILPTSGAFRIDNLELHTPTLRSKQLTLPLNDTSEPAAGSAKKDEATPTRLNFDIHSLRVDNGTFTLLGESEKVIDSWQAIQISLKKENQNGLQGDASNPAYFKVSAEKDDSQVISYQGKLGKANLPEGEFRAENVPVEAALRFLGIKNTAEAAGTANAKGFVKINKGGSSTGWQTNISEAVLNFSDLSLQEHAEVWLSSPAVHISGLYKQGNTLHLGKIQSTSTTMSINTDALPQLVQSVGAPGTGVSVDALDIQGNLTLYRKHNSSSQLDLQNISLQTINLSTPEKSSERNNFNLRAKVGEQGVLQVRGKVQVKPLAVNVATSIEHVRSSQLLPWLSKNSLITQLDADLAAEGEFTFPDVNYTGKLSLSNGSLTEQGTPYLKWKTLTFPDLRFSKDPLHLGGETIFLETPHLYFTRSENSKHDLSELNGFFRKYIPAKHSNPQSTTIIPKLDFDKITISSAVVTLRDNRLSPPWAGEMTAVDGIVEKFSSNPRAPAALFSFSGLLDGVPFQLDGSNHFFNSTARGKADFSMDDYPLASFYKQLTQTTDIDSSRGSVSTAITSQWQNGVIEQNNRLELNNIEPNEDNSLLALTLALISNQDNSFTLTTSSQSTLDSDSSAVFTDALIALNKLVIKASVSPFLLATGDFSELIDKEYAEFLPGQIILSGEGQESLSSFSRLLSTHPRLGIAVRGSADQKIDGDALQKELERYEQRRVAQENLKRAKELENATEKFLEKRIHAMKEEGLPTDFVAQEIPPELYNRYAPIEPVPVEIDTTMLEDLADRRAQVIKDFFIHKLALEPERITLTKPSLITTEADSHGNRVPFTLKGYTTTMPTDSVQTTQPAR